MIKQLKLFFGRYTADFWIFAIVITGITAVMYYAGDGGASFEDRLLASANDRAHALERVMRVADSAARLGAHTDVEAMAEDILGVANLAQPEEENSACFFYQSLDPSAQADSVALMRMSDRGYVVLRAHLNEDIAAFVAKAKSSQSAFWVNLDLSRYEKYFLLFTPILRDGKTVGILGVGYDALRLQAALAADSLATRFALFNAESDILLGEIPFGFDPAYTGQVQRAVDGYTQWLSAYVDMPGGYYLVESRTAFVDGTGDGLTIVVFGFVIVLCVFLVQTNRRNDGSLLEVLLKRATRKFEGAMSAGTLIGYQAIIIMLFVFLLAFFLFGVYGIISGGNTLMTAASIAVMTAVGVVLFVYVRAKVSDRLSYCLNVLLVAIPFLIHFLGGSFQSSQLPNAFLWSITATAFSMFLLNRKYAKWFFQLFAIGIMLTLLYEMIVHKYANPLPMMEFAANLFFVGFAMYASLEMYLNRSMANYAELADVYERLKDTQTQMVQQEKMVTLGQLIAGVAHEINTPIGAVKASAELLDATSSDMVLKVISATKHYTPDDMEALSAVLGICKASIKNMRSTIELRRGRNQLRKYMEQIDLPKRAEIAEYLTRMEICDIEKVENNLDVFLRDNIEDILKTSLILLPFINSVHSIKFASEKVTKIVFSLKSFSHMNAAGEETEFDIVQSIENVLVLYHNQLKTGIEIEKRFDDNIPPVYGNSDELNQVWTNIVQNAIYAMSNVGKLLIGIHLVQENKAIEISFTDSGCGIAPENMKKIFAAFYTTKPLGEGSGLGLDISLKVARKHGGDIRVSSQLGVGTTFTVVLPLKKAYGSEARL